MNIENLKTLLTWVKKDNAKHFHMKAFAEFLDADIVPEDAKDLEGEPLKYIECNTAFCFAGYANILRMEEAGFKPADIEDFSKEMNRDSEAAAWLGLDPFDQAGPLFYMENRLNISREDFDSFPEEVRVKVAVQVLEHLIETGKVDWDTPLEPYRNHYGY